MAVSEKDSDSLSVPKCGICLEDVHQLKLLPCLHSFCRECLTTRIEALSRNGRFKCPACRTPTAVPENHADGFDNVFAISASFQSQSSVLHCDVCKGGTCSNLCLDCNESNCQTCSNHHTTSKMARNHRMVSLGEGGRNIVVSGRLYCNAHESQELKCFCIECEEPICFVCNMTTHKHHQVEELNINASRKRRNLAKILQEDIDQKTTQEVQSRLSCVTQEEDMLSSDVAEKCNLLTKHAQTVKDQIDQHTAELVVKLQEQAKVRLDDYCRRKTILQTKLTSFKSASDTARSIIDGLRDSSLVIEYSGIKQKLETQTSISEYAPNDRLGIKYLPGALSKEVISKLMGKHQLDVKLNPNFQVNFLCGFQAFTAHSVLALFIQKSARAICVFDDGTAWIGKDNIVRLYNTSGKVLEVADTGAHVFDIAKDPTGQVFLACRDSIKTLDQDKKATTRFPLPRQPVGIVCTQEGDITVCFQDSSLIVVYSKDGKLQKQFKMAREDGVAVKPYGIAYNINDDLVVTAVNTEDITVFDPKGNVKTVIQTRNMQPMGVACSVHGHIYVADFKRHLVNMYSIEGCFLRTVITSNDHGLFGPCGLALDSAGHLWVGTISKSVNVYKITS